jgi:Uma2 family endonuclease
MTDGKLGKKPKKPTGVAPFLQSSYCLPMGALNIELPPQEAQLAFNERRWAEVLADAELAQIEGRIETDRHGRIIMSPPALPVHGSYQSEIAYHLRTLMPQGRVYTECPISTADGVKAADVTWASPQRLAQLGNRAFFPKAPEICVEVLSPGNTPAEMKEKTALYFDAGAQEVWLCSKDGDMTFRGREAAAPLNASRLCPTFPNRIILR